LLLVAGRVSFTLLLQGDFASFGGFHAALALLLEASKIVILF
jgi:hypothetical protein